MLSKTVIFKFMDKFYNQGKIISTEWGKWRSPAKLDLEFDAGSSFPSYIFKCVVFNADS